VSEDDGRIEYPDGFQYEESADHKWSIALDDANSFRVQHHRRGRYAMHSEVYLVHSHVNIISKVSMVVQ